MQRAPSLRRQLDRKTHTFMQHRGQGPGTKKTVLFVTAFCVATVIFTSFYVAHVTRTAASFKAVARDELAALRAATAEAAGKKSYTDDSYSDQSLRVSGQIAQPVRSAEGWVDGLGDQFEWQDGAQEAVKTARFTKGQHDDFLVVLSVDDDKHELLQATEQLWQVCSFKRAGTGRDTNARQCKNHDSSFCHVQQACPGLSRRL
jgi:hypothetical protein